MTLLAICVVLAVLGFLGHFTSALPDVVAFGMIVPLILYVVGLVLFWLFVYDPNEELDE